MAPKGSREHPKDMGRVGKEGDFWLAAAKIGGRRVRGPPRTERRQADEDLAQAQQAVSQEQMQDILLQLKAEALQSEGVTQGDAHSLRGACSGLEACSRSRETDEQSHPLCQISPRAISESSEAQSLTGISAQEVEGAVCASVGCLPTKREVSDVTAPAQSLTGLSAVSVRTPAGTSAEKLHKVMLSTGDRTTRKDKSKTGLEISSCPQKEGLKPNLLQRLAKPRSPASKTAAKRLRQTTDAYNRKRRIREITPKYRFARQCKEALPKFKSAKQARQRTEGYKAKKRLWERGPKAKISRQQRKWARFWEPCFFNWNLVRGRPGKTEINKAPAFAPRFHSDGRISILQHGVAKYLPCPDEAPLLEPEPQQAWSESSQPNDEEVVQIAGLRHRRADDKADKLQRLVWKAVWMDGVSASVLDATGGLSGNALAEIRKSIPDIAYCYPVWATVSENRRPVQLPDRRSEALGGSFHTLEMSSAEAEAVPSSVEGSCHDSDDEMEDIARWAESLLEPNSVCTATGKHESVKTEFSIALELRCRIGAINCVAELGRGFDNGRGCCAKWSRKEIRTWKDNQRLCASSWRCSRPFWGELKTREELESSDQPLHKDQLRLGIFEDLGVPWFWNSEAAPVPPHNGCVHSKRLKRGTWPCPMAAHSHQDILEAVKMLRNGVPDSSMSVTFLRELSDPSKDLRPYLCCNSCPLLCCTSLCPWSSSEVTDSEQPRSLQACSCKSENCSQCRREALLNAAHADVCLEEPVPPGHVLYTGSIEPSLGSSSEAQVPALYVLTCRFWAKRHYFLGSAPPENIRTNAHVKECIRRCGGKPQDYLFNNEVARKDYSASEHRWTSSEGRLWSAHAFPESDYKHSNGYEWQWERVDKAQEPALASYPHVPVIAVEESAEIVSSLGGSRLQCCSLKEPLSLRCSFCTFLHGSPGGCPSGVRRPPEDIAVRIAQAVVCLHSLWYGTLPRIYPCTVLRCADVWAKLDSLLHAHLKDGSLHFNATQIYTALWTEGPEQCCNFIPDRCVLPDRARAAAEAAFIEQLISIRADLLKRAEDAMRPEQSQRQAEQDLNIVRVDGHHQLTHHFTQDLITKHGFKCPLYAMLVPGKMPRLSLGATADCTCCVPWNKRPLWDRTLHVQYVLPPATSPWQSEWTVDGKHWLAVGIDGDPALADELIRLEASAGDNELSGYCQAMQALLAGRAVSMTPQADLAQLSRSDAGSDHEFPVQRMGSAISFCAEPGGVATSGRDDVSKAIAADRPLVCKLESSGAPALGSPHENPIINWTCSHSGKDADLLSWPSEVSSDTSEQDHGAEQSDMDDTEETEGTPKVFEGASGEEGEEESYNDDDYEDDGADWSACALPSTPPRMERKEFDTPPKFKAPSMFDSDGEDSDTSHVSSYSRRWHAKGVPLAISYCNESECY